MERIDSYFSEVVNAIMHLDRKIVYRIIDLIKDCDETGNKILVAGNGGSSTTASHFAGDLSKTCRLESYCLTDSHYLVTALGNDHGYHNIFSKQIDNIGCKEDLYIAISGSGNSSNIIEAIETAKSHRLTTIGLTGFDGGLVKDLCDIYLIVPSNHMEVIEDVHLAICHCIVEQLKNAA